MFGGEPCDPAGRFLLQIARVRWQRPVPCYARSVLSIGWKRLTTVLPFLVNQDTHYLQH